MKSFSLCFVICFLVSQPLPAVMKCCMSICGGGLALIRGDDRWFSDHYEGSEAHRSASLESLPRGERASMSPQTLSSLAQGNSLFEPAARGDDLQVRSRLAGGS